MCGATVTRSHDMTTKALFVKLEAKPGKENEVAKFLRDGQSLVQQEPFSPLSHWRFCSPHPKSGVGALVEKRDR